MAIIAAAAALIERARSMGPCVRRDDVSKKRGKIAKLIRALRNRRLGSRACHRVDKAVAGVGMPLPARLEHVAQQKTACQGEAIFDIFLRPIRRSFFALTQKSR